MAETKKAFYTANGLLVDGNADFNNDVKVYGSLSLGTNGKLILQRQAAADGVLNECRVNSSTGNFEIHDGDIWKSAFVGGLKWDAVGGHFTIHRLTDDQTIVIPYVHDTTDYLMNVGYYQSGVAGTKAKPILSKLGATNTGMYFISDGVAFSGSGADLFQADTTSFRLKYGVSGAETFVGNVGGNVSKVAFTADSTLEVKGASTFRETVTIANGDIDITTGRVLSGGNVIGFSDERIKTEWQSIENALERILSMEGGTYHNQVTDTREVGLRAQQVRKALAEAVTETGKDVTLLSGEEIENVLAVAYGNLAGLWVEGFRVIDNRLQKLEELCSNEQDQ